ncbi:MAG: ABC transporter ATP-binding protein [Holophaga sp.]|nr:ABC transporter ATP-binding protein [Holophaga sp.]
MIELIGASCSYGEGDVLSQIDITISRGDAVAVIGPNGCGKSTLLKLLNGIIPLSAGNYRLDGEDISAASLKDAAFAKRFHQRIGFLFQNSNAQLFCPVVSDEIAFGPRQMGLEEPEVLKRVEDCLQFLGIGKLRARVPYHLSEGEKRKVALASVLALNPEVLVLDEPMNGLDPRMKRFLGEIIISLNESGKTIICSTHDFKYVDSVFRTAVVIGADHRIARIGPYREIIQDKDFLRSQNIL